MNTKINKHTDILDYLHRKGSATVCEISSVFFISESTVRRLLVELEKDGMIVRFHGGAIMPGWNHSDQMELREVRKAREKAAIGRAAAALVQEGMTVLLMGGTTVQAVCPYLAGRSITVITSSIPVINMLLPEKGMKLILLGGVVNPPELEVRGSMTLLGLDRLRADILFTGATNVHPVHGLMTDDPEAVSTYRACMKATDRNILLADSTKFKTGGVTVVAGLDEFSGIITDEGLPPEKLESLQSRGIKITVIKLHEGENRDGI